MTNQQTKGDFILDSLDPKKFRESLEYLNKDKEEEESEQTEFFRCNHCNPIANLFPGDEIFWDDEHGWLCGRCLGEEEEAREAIADEKKLHNKGGA